MDNQHNKTNIHHSDVKQLSSLIVEFNIARRNIGSYPKGHPLITASLNKVIKIYNQLLEQNGVIVIGIARNVLMVNGVLLEKNNLIFRGFAKVLFEHGIGALTLRRGLSLNELKKFYEILCMKREELLNVGGISLIWEQASIASLEIQPIRYDLLRATDPRSTKNKQQMPQGLWERFARKLVQGTLNAGNSFHVNGKDKEHNSINDVLDPKTLALILNHQMGITGQELPDTTFCEDMTALFQELIAPPFGQETEPAAIPYEELTIFINALNPGLRRLLFKNSIVTDTGSNDSLTAEIISRLSVEATAEILEDVKQNRIAEQPRLIELLLKMSSDTTRQPHSFPEAPDDMSDVHQTIRSIFREDSFKDFVPDSYRNKLDRIMGVEHGHHIEPSELTDLLNTFDSHFVENQISHIIVRIMAQIDDPGQMTQLVDKLGEMFIYLRETGNYEQIIKLMEQSNTSEMLPEVCNRLRQIYTTQEYLNEILVGLSTWGKSRYADISRLIVMIGEPFIEILLDRLATEETLSLRRFLMDRIQEFGPLAREAMIARLSDKRWFVLRNLIIMLRQLNDITILEHIRPLLRNGHLRVRQEALRACLFFNDPSAERQILHDMDCSDRETQLAAINLADKNSSVNMFNKLLAIIGTPGFSNSECELKSAAVHALAEIGRPEALPELARLLASKSLLHPRLLTKLKFDVIRSMCLYQPAVVQPILTRLASGNGEVARQVQLALKMIMEKTT